MGNGGDSKGRESEMETGLMLCGDLSESYEQLSILGLPRDHCGGHRGPFW